MAKKRQLKGVSAVSLPTGPVLLGRFVAALGLPSTGPGADILLRSKTTHRFFSGERIEDEKIVEIFSALGVALVELGFTPSTGWRPSSGPSPAERASHALRHMVTHWDAVIAALRGGLLHGAESKVVVLAAARLLVVDVALRTAAWLALVGTALDTTSAPPVPAAATILNDLIRRTGLHSRKDIAKACKVERTTVDDWTNGAQITDDNLGQLVFLVDGGRDPESVWYSARRGLALARIFGALRAYVGTDFDGEVDDLWRGVVHFAVRFSQFMAQSRLVGEERFEPPADVLAFGAASRPAPFVVNNALKQEQSTTWAAVLEAGPAWPGFLVQAARVARSAINASKAGLSDEETRGAALMMLGRPRQHVPVRPGWQYIRVLGDDETKARNRMTQYYDAVERGDFVEAVDHARRAARLTPQVWLPHFLLGAGLGRLGDVDNGIAECWIAARLATSERDVDLAKVEVGIILTNVGRHEEACAHLEDLYTTATERSAHLLYNLGIVRMRCQMFDKALEALKLVLAKEEHHPDALDSAAHCAFVLGDRRAGIEYAKAAKLLGVDNSYNAWRNGNYAPRRKG